MRHLGEDELVDLHYGEGTSAAREHLDTCGECAARLAEFRQGLEAIAPTPAPEKGPEFGDRVWQNLAPRLIPYEKKSGGRSMRWRYAVLAAGGAVVLVMVFLGGRYWERATARKANLAASPEASERVVLVVLTDHLDRTERLLVELEHADSPDRAESAEMQSEARELLASNRLYRANASRSEDPALSGALDRVERVLTELANDPGLTPADLERVRKEMNTEGILFEVRVLKARGLNPGSGPKPAKGVSI